MTYLTALLQKDRLLEAIAYLRDYESRLRDY